MLNVFVSLLPLALIGLVSPALTSLCILLLSTRRPLANAVAFVLGGLAILLTVGTLVVVWLGNALQDLQMPELGPVLSIVLGLLFLVLALRFYFDVPEPDAPPPQWLGLIDTITPLKAFLFGVVLIGTNIKILGTYGFGLYAIAEAHLGLIPSLIELAMLLVIVLLAIVVPVAIYAARPDQANRLLAMARVWLQGASRIILIVISLALGLYFTARGVLA